jgi:hypothetical protein
MIIQILNDRPEFFIDERSIPTLCMRQGQVLSIAMKRFCVHVWQPSVFSLGPII